MNKIIELSEPVSVIVLIGSPGSNTKKLAQILGDKFGGQVICFGPLITAISAEQKEEILRYRLISQAKSQSAIKVFEAVIDSGIDSSMCLYELFKFPQTIVLEGFPRSYEQLKAFLNFMEIKKFNPVFVWVKATETEDQNFPIEGVLERYRNETLPILDFLFKFQNILVLESKDNEEQMAQELCQQLTLVY